MLGSETAAHTDGLVGCFRGLVMNNEGKACMKENQYTQ